MRSFPSGPLRRREYRLLLAANTVALTGEFMQLVALSGAALDLSGRPSAWGAVLVAQAVPQATLMLAGGVAVDRFGWRRVLLAANLVVLADLVWLATRLHPTLGNLYIFAAVFGGGYAFLLPASSTAVPELVPPQEVQGGNALLAVSATIAQFIGPLFATPFGSTSSRTLFAVVAGLWAVSGVLLLRLPAAPGRRRASPGIGSALSAGLRTARADPVISSLSLAAAVFALGYGGAVYVGLPTLARLSFAAGDRGVALLYGASGAGALVGALLSGEITRAGHQGLTGGLAITASGVLLAAAAVAGGLWGAIPLIVASGLCWSVGLVVTLTGVQTRSPAELRGRVISLFTLGFFGIYPFSYALAGVAGDALGPRGIVLCGGGLMAVAGAFALSRRAVREGVL